MPNSLKKIFAVFVIVGALPLAYLIYEFSSLNEDEELFQQIYEGQLDAVLFSINQYSIDVAEGWVNEVSNALKYKESRSEKIDKISKEISRSKAIKYVYLFNQMGSELGISYKEEDFSELSPKLRELSMKNVDVSDQLIRYKQAGYQKLVGLDSADLGLYPILFALDTTVGEFSMGMMLISTEDFVNGNLRGKLLEIAGEQFVVSVRREGNDQEVFSTAQLEHGQREEVFFELDGPRRNLWIFPDYYLTITQKGTSIRDLVKKRSEENMMILSVIFVLLIVGLLFLFTNIKRELYLSNAKSEFVSNVSHEIRTPLALISMFAETLEMGRAKTEEKKQEYYKIIRKETYRLSKIVNSILSFSKMDANKRTYQFDEIDLRMVIQEILDNYKIQLDGEGFELKLCFDHQDLIYADKEAASEAIINLLDNAMKYSDVVKKIEIHTGQINDRVYVEVRDSGIGIPKAYQKEVFDQFFRTPSNNIHKTKGSGLGLTIVKKIMEAHKGHVELESVPSKGSTFRLLFPTLIEN